MIQEPIEVIRAGAVIRGMTYRPGPADRTRRCPAVLMLHGFTGQRMEAGFMFVSLGRALVQRGVAAVTFDFLHSGESDGGFEQMLVSGELADALHMARWTQSRPFVDRSRLAILGFSLGGLLASCVQARTGAFQAMALLAPTTAENLNRFARKKASEGRVLLGPHELHPRFFEDLGKHDPIGDAVRHPRPTLVVQGTADTSVPPEVSGAYVEALKRAGVPVTRQLIDGADHAFTKAAARQELIEMVSAWLAGEVVD